jgi:uncharacterized protein
MLNVVIDTNVLLSAIGYKSPLRLIFDSIINKEINLCVSNEIMLEYYEIISRKMTDIIARNFTNYLRNSSNILFTEIYFKWNLITIDESDNKFTDCYINSNADYLITNDSHFNILRRITFPKINLVNSGEFLEIIARDKN